MKLKLCLMMIVSLLLLGWYKYDLDRNYKENLKNFQNYTKQANRLIFLQKKWSNKEEDRAFLKKIKKRFNAKSYRVEKDIHTLLFEDLTKTTLDRVSKAILNSDLIIKKLKVENKNSKISLYLEVKI